MIQKTELKVFKQINYFRLGRKNVESLGAVSRLGSRLNRLKGALKHNPVAEGQTCSIDVSFLDLESDTEFVSDKLLKNNDIMCFNCSQDLFYIQKSPYLIFSTVLKNE